MRELTFIIDPGHGWLEVPVSELLDFRIADQISACSYLHRGNAYLEEDCDAGKYIRALQAHGQTFHVNERYEEVTAIRGYRSYDPASL
jgi:hypothetical protein